MIKKRGMKLSALLCSALLSLSAFAQEAAKPAQAPNILGATPAGQLLQNTPIGKIQENMQGQTQQSAQQTQHTQQVQTQQSAQQLQTKTAEQGNALPARFVMPPKPAEQLFVFDYARMLEPGAAEEMKLTAQEIKKSSGAEITVVTIDTLGDEILDEVANKLFNSWGIGDKKLNNGLLLMVVKDRVLAGKSGRVRLEVGYGLEGALTDTRSGRILDDITLPAWERKEYSKGIYDTFQEVAKIVKAEYTEEVGIKRAEAKKSSERNGKIFFIVFVAGFILLIYLANKYGSHGSGGSSSGSSRRSYSSGGSSRSSFGGGRSGGGGASR